MGFIDNIKYKFNTGSIIEKLIYINVGIFAVTLLLTIAQGLFRGQPTFIVEWFALDDNLSELFTKPWSLISYGFLHSGFIHLLFNMIGLYFIGNLFIQYFTQKQALQFYLLGTLFGGFFYLFSQNYFPLFEGSSSRLVGASAGVSAIFIGLATYMPNYQINVRLLGYIKLWHLAAVWLAFDLVGLIGPNAGGSFSHLGGSLFGFLFVNQASNKKIDIFGSIFSIFKRKEKPLQTVYKAKTKSKNTTTTPTNNNQKKIDEILDKISKSGYDTLTKAEKEFLFKQGKS
ncbi:rhomboid family intramembrane serine protease [uncultured Polaribacter sp.]|uniref:rhomboid family intramembrane serine protease n=1 Tax=uncultured Polaribacter sp. TaxID=174711 RepID=UPI00260F3277|nr:rhomboid family intramembrane serine protease [uncultured Polaribacter sp.]